MKKILIIAALFIGLKAQAQVSYVPIQDGYAKAIYTDSLHTRIAQDFRIQIYVNDTAVGWATLGEAETYCTYSNVGVDANQLKVLVTDSIAAYIYQKKWLKK